MPQTIILKGQTHVFPAGSIVANADMVTTQPAIGTITYALGANPPFVIPLPGGRVFQFTLPVNGAALTIINNTSSGLTCVS